MKYYKYYKEEDIIYLRQRRIKHWFLVLIFLVIVLIGVRLRITSVSVKGQRTYTAQEAENLVFANYWDRNTVVCLANRIRGKQKTLPFVSEYQINLTGPTSCDLIIYEKNPVGCINYMSNYMYFDKDGLMIESSQEKLANVPVIRGVNFGHVVLGKKLPVSSDVLFSDIMNITQQFALFGIGCEGIKFDDLLRITVTLEGGDIDVEMGSNADISAKIAVLNDMLPQLRERGLSGTLDLSSYSDTDKRQTTSFRVRK